MRKGVQLVDFLYIGVTTIFKSRFDYHHLNNTFNNYEKLERAVLINGISREKTLFLGKENYLIFIYLKTLRRTYDYV